MDKMVECFDRGSRLGFINSLGYSKGETGELKSQSYRCLDVNYVTRETFDELYADVDEVSGKMHPLFDMVMPL